MRQTPRALAGSCILGGLFLVFNTSSDAQVPRWLHYVRPPGPGIDSLVAFVHGVFGDARDTWTNGRSKAYWPELIKKDKDLDEFSILVIDYRSPKFKTAGTIEQVATQIGTALKDEGIYNKYRSVFFVAHSMGGLITRRILIDLNRPTTVTDLRRVAAALFFSTPTSGAPIADLGSWISLNPQLSDMKPADVNTFLQSLDNQWEDLLRDRDSQGRVRPRAYCAYELFDTVGIKVVPLVYTKSRCDEKPIPFDKNHVEIVKPEGFDDPVYKWTKARLLGLNRIQGGERSWDGGERLGELLKTLASWYRRDIIAESVRYAPAVDQDSLDAFWVRHGPYKGRTWGEILQLVAKDYPCLSVRILRQTRDVELGVSGRLKECPDGKNKPWVTCDRLSCAR